MAVKRRPEVPELGPVWTEFDAGSIVLTGRIRDPRTVARLRLLVQQDHHIITAVLRANPRSPLILNEIDKHLGIWLEVGNTGCLAVPDFRYADRTELGLERGGKVIRAELVFRNPGQGELRLIGQNRSFPLMKGDRLHLRNYDLQLKPIAGPTLKIQYPGPISTRSGALPPGEYRIGYHVTLKDGSQHYGWSSTPHFAGEESR